MSRYRMKYDEFARFARVWPESRPGSVFTSVFVFWLWLWYAGISWLFPKLRDSVSCEDYGHFSACSSDFG